MDPLKVALYFPPWSWRRLWAHWSSQLAEFKQVHRETNWLSLYFGPTQRGQRSHQAHYSKHQKRFIFTQPRSCESSPSLHCQCRHAGNGRSFLFRNSKVTYLKRRYWLRIEFFSNSETNSIVPNWNSIAVKQSAALCMLRLYRAAPQHLPSGEWQSRIIHLLNDSHLGVVTRPVVDFKIFFSFKKIVFNLIKRHLPYSCTIRSSSRQV